MIVLIFSSCSKQLQNQNTSLNSTTSLTLKSEATGVTLADAKLLAKSFLQRKNPNSTVIIENAETIVKNGIPYFHVINANKGFVILSPDSVYEPILAYDSIGNFSFEEKNLNPGLKMWFNKHASELDFVRNTKSTYVDSIKAVNKRLWQAVGNTVEMPVSLANNRPANGTIENVPPPTLISTVPTSYSTESTVGPLCLTAWNQDYPFNYYCPPDPAATLNNDNGIDPAGCTPVAIAQLMYFWKYPTTLNWNGMPSTELQAGSLPITGALGDLAHLLRNLGNAGGTGWGPKVSNTVPEHIPTMIQSQGYTSVTATESQFQQALSGAEDGTTFAGLLRSELQTNKRPCIVSGFPIYHGSGVGILPYAGGNGHTWVCDGSDVTTYYSGYIYTYKSFYGVITTQTTYTNSTTISLLHMNWGWGGTDQIGINYPTNNGWYDCSINYTQSGSASGDDNFQYFQIIDYNIHP